MTAVDTIYVNGRIWPGGAVAAAGSAGPAGAPEPTALAVAGGRVVACGATADVRDLAGPGTEVVDLGGRRLVPGLIDGHLHAVRAGPTWDRELHWTGLPTLAAAVARVRDAAAAAAPGDWIRAVGGWHPSQFAERRLPTRAELDAAAPDHPVYVQALYEVAVLNTAALRATGFDAAADPPGGVVERHPDGSPTGRVRGLGAFTACLAAMPAADAAAELRGTAAMQRDLHAAGLTGIVDAGGFGMSPERYDTLFELWRRGGLTLRTRLFVSAVDPGREYEQLDGWLRHAQRGFGDALLRIAGIGEVVHFGCHDFEGLEPFTVSDVAGRELTAITRRAAERGWPMQVHAALDSTIDRILDCWESVHADVPLTGLRFVLAHVDTIGARNIGRLAALGAGVVVDDHLVFKAARSEQVWGEAAIRRAPPLGDLLAAGIPVAAGTDATRASSYDPWLALWWLVAGRSVDGVERRSGRHLLSREQALHAYTAGSAWLSFEEADRGHLRPGARADLAVLDADYFTIPTDAIPAVAADLTVVGGRVVHSTGAIG